MLGTAGVLKVTKRSRTIVIFIIYYSLFAIHDSELVLQECLKVKKGKVVIIPFAFPLGRL